MTRKFAYIFLGLVLLLAVGLRFYGITWDSGFDWSPHPDERAILMKVPNLNWPDNVSEFLSPESPANPDWFPYGSFPLYLLRSLDALTGDTDLRLVGRAVSALFDTGTVLLIYLIGARLYGRRTGLLAGLLLAVAVLPVQLSHFFAVDTILAFLVALAMLASWGIARRGDIGSAALAGLALGLALATKISAAPLVLPVAFAYFLFLIKEAPPSLAPVRRGAGHRWWLEWNKDAPVSRVRLRQAALGGVLTFALAAAVFAAVQPYTFLDWESFRHDTLEQAGMVRRILDYPYTRQYIDTPAYLYPIQQLGTWGLGLPLGIAAWGGLAFVAVRAVRRRSPADLLLLSWVVPYFLITGGFQVKFLRYLMPLVPFLVLMGAEMLLSFRDWLRERWRWVAMAAIVLVATLSAAYSLAYVHIYSTPHSAVEASRWLKANMLPGSVLLKEHWEEALPHLDGFGLKELNLYDGDGLEKAKHIAERLAGADALIFYSNRLYGTIPRLPQRYPMTTQYYRLLMSGGLGYELKFASSRYPELLGVAIGDDTFSRPGLPRPTGLKRFLPNPLWDWGFADESFTVYDHPLVLVFVKTESIPASELQELVQNYPGANFEFRISNFEKGVLSPGDAEAQQAGGTWSQIVQRASLANRFPALVWAGVAQVLGLLAFPLTFLLFRPFRDRGWLLSKPVGLLLVAYGTWMLASLKWLPFGQGSILLAALALGLVSLLVGLAVRRQLVAYFRAHWGLVLLGEAVFWGAFLLFLGLRAWNPDLWHPFRGGEKPMDFAYLNAVIKSSYMPPYDPWFAGGYLNYYYFGQFLVATLAKVTGIVPSVAYNLAVPLLFAFTVGGAFSVVYSLAEARRGPGPWWRSTLLAGLLAGLMVAVIGNLDGLAQMAQGVWRVIGVGGPFPVFDFWRSSRIMAPSFAITEFPFFTFLFADLHAHLIALPFTVLAAALALSAVLWPRGGWSSWASRPVLLVALGLVLGVLRVTNSWDFPAYWALAGAALFLADLRYWREREGTLGARALSLVSLTLLQMGILYLLTQLLYLPFHQNFALFYGGFQRSPEQTSLVRYVGIHGLFLFAAGSFLGLEVYRSLRVAGSADAHRLYLGTDLKRGVAVRLVLVVLLVLAMVASGLHWVTVAFLGLFLGVVLIVFLRDILSADPAHLFVLVLLGLAAGLGVAVDLVTLKGDIVRMNTVFKFYLQAWVLFALAGAYCLWWYWSQTRGVGRRIWLGFAVFLLAASVIYPLAATPVRARDRFNPLPATLDGAAFMEEAVYNDRAPLVLAADAEAIRWLQDNVRGSPVVLEAASGGSHVPLYRWGSRVSVYTGLPTVLGWDWHQKQQRWGYQEQVDARLADVRTLYGSQDAGEVRRLLGKYRVRYIYVGALERAYYPPTGLATFDAMVGQDLRVVYERDGVKIYEVFG